MHTLLLLCIDYWCSSCPLIDKLFEINEWIGKIDLIGLNIRRFIYFIEWLYLWFITIDFRGLFIIDIMFMLVSWILLLIDWIVLWIMWIRLWIGLLIVALMFWMWVESMEIRVWHWQYEDMKRIQLLLKKNSSLVN